MEIVLQKGHASFRITSSPPIQSIAVLALWVLWVLRAHSMDGHRKLFCRKAIIPWVPRLGQYPVPAFDVD